jgi:hypothetical protein
MAANGPMQASNVRLLIEAALAEARDTATTQDRSESLTTAMTEVATSADDYQVATSAGGMRPVRAAHPWRVAVGPQLAQLRNWPSAVQCPVMGRNRKWSAAAGMSLKEGRSLADEEKQRPPENFALFSTGRQTL